MIGVLFGFPIPHLHLTSRFSKCKDRAFSFLGYPLPVRLEA